MTVWGERGGKMSNPGNEVGENPLSKAKTNNKHNPHIYVRIRVPSMNTFLRKRALNVEDI